MNKEGNNSNYSVKSSNSKKVITGFIVGGAILGALYYSYKKIVKNKNNTDSNEVDNKITPTSVENQSADNNENKNYKNDEVIIKLVELLCNDPIFGPENIYINSKVDRDFDENNLSYVKVDYVGEDLAEDNPYISVIIKMSDTLYSKNRKKDFFDRDQSLKDLRDLLFNVKSRKKYGKLSKYRVEPLSFYFIHEGIPGELLDIKDMRELKSISGFRYIRIKFTDLSESGIEFVKDVLHELHVNGGEEDSKFNISSFVIDKNDGDVQQLEDNCISSEYLDNGERHKK